MASGHYDLSGRRPVTTDGPATVPDPNLAEVETIRVIRAVAAMGGEAHVALYPPACVEVLTEYDRLGTELAKLRRGHPDAEIARNRRLAERIASGTAVPGLDEVIAGARDMGAANLDVPGPRVVQIVDALMQARAQRDAVLALADGWESDAEAFTSGEAFRRYIVAQIHDQYGVSE